MPLIKLLEAFESYRLFGVPKRRQAMKLVGSRTPLGGGRDQRNPLACPLGAVLRGGRVGDPHG